ncbi:MAG: 3-dehydroquinate synthase II [Desulfobacterales bacterium]|nr:3-dehydroquinate synthase II [Desulfobacterales bacterium]
MRKIWVKVDPWDKSMITTALEGGVDGIMVPKGYSKQVKKLGKIQTISEDGDLRLGKDVIFFTIKSGDDEDEIVKLGRSKKIILQCENWTVIPLENLIAKGADVIVQVDNLKEAETVFGILEKGAQHILFHTTDPAELIKVLSFIRSKEERVSLETAEIQKVTPIGMGDRVCVDTCTSMVQGQGMLVGNTSSALFLVHAETVLNPYVAPRPFRVNAGPVHAYTKVPEGKTRYLSELLAGDRVLIVDFKGNVAIGAVGRLKIEKRPLMLVKATVNEREVTTVLQNAETVRLTSPEGNPISVVKLSPGVKVLVVVEKGGRHFGHKIEESITER